MLHTHTHTKGYVAYTNKHKIMLHKHAQKIRMHTQTHTHTKLCCIHTQIIMLHTHKHKSYVA